MIIMNDIKVNGLQQKALDRRAAEGMDLELTAKHGEYLTVRIHEPVSTTITLDGKGKKVW